MSNLYAALSIKGSTEPAAIFARLHDGRTVSYADVEKRSARFANALRTRGVTPGARVAVQAEKSIDFLMLYLGTIRCGAVFLPLNPAYTASELEHFLSDAEPALLVCDPSKIEALAPLARRIGVSDVQTLGATGDGSLADLASVAEDRFETVERGANDLAAILYTSGTTGKSKGAMLTHENLVSNAMTLREAWRFSREDVLLHALPVFHTHGLFVATNVTIAAGASMILLPRFEPDAVIDALSTATVMMGVPTFYIRLLADERLDQELVTNVRLFVSGSAPLSAEVHREFANRTGHAILERYGMTETNMNTSNPYDGTRVPGSVGSALPGIRIRITDPQSGAELPQGDVGNIEIAGPNVFLGYWKLPDKTMAEFHEGYFVSGDLGYIDENRYVFIVGRAKDLIISGGFNVYPAEVETALEELGPVREAAVVGVPHPDLGEGVIAVVVPSDPSAMDETVILQDLSDRLARFKQPRRILFVDELPKNAMGKVQKKDLRECFCGTFEPLVHGAVRTTSKSFQKG